MIDNTLNIEILTTDGFKKFDGIVRKEKQVLKVTFDTTSIRCTPNHRFLHNRAWIEAKSVKPGMVLSNRRVISVSTQDATEYVYDPVNVQDTSSYISNGVVSHNCSFVGSSHTLIAGEKLASLPSAIAKQLLPNGTLRQYREPVDNHSYVMCVDTSRGKGLDYSTFQIIDISELPYQIVCTYQDNTISTLVFPEVIYRIAEIYNNAFVLIETNDLGQQVADILFYDLEYENVYMSSNENIKEGGGNRASPGLRTTKKTKAVGCDMLKSLIENDKLDVNDAETINEFTTFVRVATSYKAEDGKHDDLVMPLVMFGYLTSQPVFKDLFDFSLTETKYPSMPNSA